MGNGISHTPSQSYGVTIYTVSTAFDLSLLQVLVAYLTIPCLSYCISLAIKPFLYSMNVLTVPFPSSTKMIFVFFSVCFVWELFKKTLISHCASRRGFSAECLTSVPDGQCSMADLRPTLHEVGWWQAESSLAQASAHARHSPPLNPHHNRPLSHWPCVKSCLVGGSDKYLRVINKQ